MHRFAINVSEIKYFGKPITQTNRTSSWKIKLQLTMKSRLHRQKRKRKREKEREEEGGSKIYRWHRWSINCPVHFADTRFLANQHGEKRRQRTTVADIPDFRTRRTTITQSTEHEHPRRDLTTFSCDDTKLASRFRQVPGCSRVNSTSNHRFAIAVWTRKNTSR